MTNVSVCQELGHMAHHCQHIQCFDCDEYGHIAADCPDKIIPPGTLACHKKHHSHARYHTRSISRHHHRDRHRFSRSRSQSHSQILKPQPQQLTQKSLQILSQMSSQEHIMSLTLQYLSLLMQHTTQKVLIT